MKKRMIMLAAVLVFSTMAVDANEKTGTVKIVDTKAKTITVTAARDLVFTVTDTTKIVQGEAKKTLADIKVGGTVDVVYDNAGDTRTATKITILSAEEKKTEKPATKGK